MKKIYKILITLWLSVGVGICGYFYIYYPHKSRIYPISNMEKRIERNLGPQYKNGKEFQSFLLVTIVGVIFISGIGFSIGKNDK